MTYSVVVPFHAAYESASYSGPFLNYDLNPDIEKMLNACCGCDLYFTEGYVVSTEGSRRIVTFTVKDRRAAIFLTLRWGSHVL